MHITHRAALVGMVSIIVNIAIATPTPPQANTSTLVPITVPPPPNDVQKRSLDDPQCEGLRYSSDYAVKIDGFMASIVDADQPVTFLDAKCENEMTVAYFCHWWNTFGIEQEPAIIRYYCKANEMCVKVGYGRNSQVWCARLAAAEIWEVEDDGPKSHRVEVELGEDSPPSSNIEAVNMYYDPLTGSPKTVDNTTFVSTRDGQLRGGDLEEKSGGERLYRPVQP